MKDNTKQKRTRWVGDTVTIALLGATFYFVEIIIVHAYVQRFSFSYTWDFKSKFLVFAIVLYCTLGILLGVLSALLLRSKRYFIAACPAILVTIAHVFQFPKMVGGDLGTKLIEVISYILGLGTLYLLVAVLVAVGITFAKRRLNFTRSRRIAIQVGLPLLAFGIGIYTGWGFGRVSVAVPDLIINTYYCLERLKCVDDGDDARLRNSLEFELDGIVRAIPIWRKAVLRPDIRKKMDATLVRIARYRQEHPKITGSGIGSEEQEPQLIEEWMQQQYKLKQAFDEQVASILKQALESAPQVNELTEGDDEKGVPQKKKEDTSVQPSARGDGIPPPQP